MKTDKIKDLFFYFLVLSWESFDNFDRNINSILSQNYSNFKIIFVDDCSEYSIKRKSYIRDRLKGHIVIFNKERKYAVRNTYEAIHNYVLDDNSVIAIVDGDDWLLNDNVLDHVKTVYQKTNCLFTYGNCYNWDGALISNKVVSKEQKLNIPYPHKVIINATYRNELFYPFHLSTFKADLFKKIDMKDFQDEKGTWLKYCKDMVYYLPMLEMVKGRYRVINKPLYVYNTVNPKNIIKSDPINTVREELILRRKFPYKVLFRL